jgi:hypothetical protein
LIQFKSFEIIRINKKGTVLWAKPTSAGPYRPTRPDPLFSPASRDVRRLAAMSAPLPALGPLSSTAPGVAPACQTPLSFLLYPGHITHFSHPSFSSAPRSSPATEWLYPPHHQLASETVARRPFLSPQHPLRPRAAARRPIHHLTSSLHRATAQAALKALHQRAHGHESDHRPLRSLRW